MGTRQLLVIRHGQTEWSRAGLHTGRTDIALTDVGRDEARAAARTLHGWRLERAYTSPLRRARETAELVSPPCGLAIDDDLVEWDYGAYEGESTPQTRERVPGWSVWTHPIVGGETADAVGGRADRFLERFDRDVPVALCGSGWGMCNQIRTDPASLAPQLLLAHRSRRAFERVGSARTRPRSR